MSNELNNILNNPEGKDNKEKLWDYLQHNLDSTSLHLFEQQMASDSFLDDAVEGLELVKNKRNIPQITNNLNKELKQKLHSGKKKRKRIFFNQPWIYIAVIIILLLTLAAYFVINRLLKP